MSSFVHVCMYCRWLVYNPYRLLAVVGFLGLQAIPFLAWYFNPKNAYDKKHRDPKRRFDIPLLVCVSISRTWLEMISYVTVPSSGLVMFIVYSICIRDWGAVLAFAFVVIDSDLVLILNGEKRGQYHSAVAMPLFTLMFALMFPANTLYYGWGFETDQETTGTTLVLINSILYPSLLGWALFFHLRVQSPENREEADYMWPNWLALNEHLFMIDIWLFLFFIPNGVPVP